ncbi:TIGR03619 family F420-dependent LLM class oxidoreductase [Actinoplanes sp. NPDC049596]|uniref:TIGR03619 family F420-dependent LLM class oxidoreductase n=1 Tax=unclassified Actinoplanes TaxID=2626549 RepID=UPI00344914E5
MPLKIGFNLPQTTQYDLAADVPTFAREAERIGYDSLWVLERVLTPIDQSGIHGLYGVPGLAWPDVYHDVADPLITLAQAAAVTTRISLGTGVLVAPLHHPVRLAKSLASLDVAAGGRLIAGLGSGWSVDEYAATSRRPMAERGAALDEFLDTTAALWGADPVSASGSGFEVAPSYFSPKPAGNVPIYLAGASEPALRRIVRRGLGWFPTGLSVEQTTQTLSRLRDRAGADVPCIVQVSYLSTTRVPADGRQEFTGSPDQLMEDVAALAAGGVKHVYLTMSAAALGLTELLDAAEQVYEAARRAQLV